MVPAEVVDDLDLEVFLFTYARAGLLANAHRSLRERFPAVPITVIDDGSTDAATLAELDRLRDEGTTVIVMPRPDLSWMSRKELAKWRGGLYVNMQHALDVCRAGHYWFLQDDEQVCRTVAPSEVRAALAALDADAGSPFLRVNFLRASNPPDEFAVLPDRRLLERRPGPRGWHAYTDTHVGHVGRLRAAGWSFLDGERACARVAAERFGPMPHLADPWSAHVPFPPTVSLGVMGPLGRHLHARATGLHPIVPMSDVERERFLARDPRDLPYPERHLRAVGVGATATWEYRWFQPGGRVLGALVDAERWLVGRLAAVRRRVAPGPPPTPPLA